MTYRKVSKDEFFDLIYRGKLDVHPHIISNKYPYTSVWEYLRKPGQPVFGQTVGRVEGGTLVTDYFIA